MYVVLVRANDQVFAPLLLLLLLNIFWYVLMWRIFFRYVFELSDL